MQKLEKEITVLYITFVDFDAPSESGSSVRPKRMYDAFRQLGCNVVLLSGITNDRKKRQEGVSRVREYLKTNKPDICYIEPPTGPLFFACDRNLIRKLYRMHIPIGFFYRDIYWKFKGSEFKESGGNFLTGLKKLVIKMMQYRDFYLLRRCVTKFYFPSASINEYMKFDDFEVLPPGCLKKDINRQDHTPVTGIYVGGATERYGMGLLLESWMNVKETVEKKLIIVCPKEQWKIWVQEHPQYEKLPKDINLYHLCDGKELEKLYAVADFALIPILKTSYNNMALPIKLYEYISNGLPVVATSCYEMQKVVAEHKVGVLADDNVSDFSGSIQEMLNNIKNGNNYAVQLETACNENLWTERVKTIIRDLQNR